MPRSARASVGGLRRLGVTALVIAVTALIAACGGSSPHKVAAKVTPATLLAQTAGAADTVRSGRLDATLDIALDGVKQLDGKPIALGVSGPFTRGPGERIATDLAIALSAAQSNVSAAIDVVDGDAYLGLGGQYYELGGDLGKRVTEATTGSSGASGTSGPNGTSGPSGASGMSGLLGGLGIDPSRWLTSPHIVGTAEVGGVATEHLHALIDVPNVLDDLEQALAPALGGATGAPGASGASGTTLPLSSVLTVLESAISSATVDIYTGVADHIVRRVVLVIAFKVPAIAAGFADGMTGGSIDLDVTLTGLNKPQTVTAPVNVQPASKLLNGVLALESQFGSLAPLVKQFGALLLPSTGGSFGGIFSSGASAARAGG